MSDKEGYFNRDNSINNLCKDQLWDVIIIGGGATGLGTALDAALRGFKTLLLEQSDFAKGTSSRSTKLIHGGVRYLAQGNIALVYESLYERGLLLQNAPHLVKRQSFVIPCYSWFSKLKYLIGLKIYDWLAGRYSFGPSRLLSSKNLSESMPEIRQQDLKGGVEYWDGQFDDSRLAINIAQTAAQKGATLVNYFKVTGLSKSATGKVEGVIGLDEESKQEFKLRGKVVINATGVFVDDILQMDVAKRKPLLRPSQGAHIVLNKSFLSGDRAMMIPETLDGRVLFAVPWHNHLVAGTTDTPLKTQSLEPVPLREEIHFILETAGQYLSKKPTTKDVLAVFAGLRPLAAPDKDTKSTKEISRSHKLIVANSGLITITGGKWTTYRKMAEDTIDKAIKVGRLPQVACNSKTQKIHGFTANTTNGPLAAYGSDEKNIENLMKQSPKLSEKLLSDYSYTKAQVIWAVRNEMARTVEDVLARRLRILFLDARAALAMAPEVASLMATELGFDKKWEFDQVESFKKIASKYFLEPDLPEFQSITIN